MIIRSIGINNYISDIFNKKIFPYLIYECVCIIVGINVFYMNRCLFIDIINIIFETI